jgi:glycosyltransferase involved in cell wall biosynthesis
MRARLHLFHVFPTFAGGGPALRTCRIANCLGHAFRHSIMAMDSHTEARSFLSDRLDVSFIHPGNRYGVLYPFFAAGTLRSLRPDLVLTHNWGSMDTVVASWLTPKYPHIHSEGGFGPDEASTQKRRRILARRVLLRHCKAVVTPALNMVRIMREIWRLPEESIHHIPNGIDCDHFAPGQALETRAALGIPENALVVGTVAYLRKVKQVDLLIRSFASLAKTGLAHLVVIGEGPDRPMLQALADRLRIGRQAHFLGLQSDTVSYYQMMDIFALSSATEQMPNSVIEAMSTGCPIVSTDVGDVSILVCPENRPYVVPLGDEKAYVDALCHLANNPQVRERLGRLNRDKCVRDYHQDVMVRAYRMLYERTCG